MYNPPLFKEADRQIIRQFITSARIAMLVSNGADGFSEVSSLLLIFDPSEGERGTLRALAQSGGFTDRAVAAAMSLANK